MPINKRKVKTKKKKAVVKRHKKLNPHAALLIKLAVLVPAMKDATGDLLESWSLFAHKILLAKRLKTSVMVITVNPQLLENREVLQKEFPCSIQSPTEARFGMDSISKF